MRSTLSTLMVHVATAGFVGLVAIPALAGSEATESAVNIDPVESVEYMEPVEVDAKDAGAPAETPARSAAKPAASEKPAPTAKAASPAAPVTGPTKAITPTVSREWVEKLSGARKEYLAASKNLEGVNTEYARALYKAGEPSKVPADIAASQKQAQDAYDAKRRVIPQLIDEARTAGVDGDILDLYARGTGIEN